MSELSEDLVSLVQQVKEGTTVFELEATYLITILKKHNGNRTRTCEEIDMPIRTLRYKIWQLESLGYIVPEPLFGGLKRKKERNYKPRDKPLELSW